MNRIVLFSVCIFKLQVFFAQNYLIKKTAENIKIDGELNEGAWQQAKPMGSFWQYFPKDSVKANFQTEIYILYDDKNIYLAAKAYSKGNKYVIPSLRRDYRAGGNDNLTFVFDTFHDNTNGFVFGTNPYGVQREALMFNGGLDNSFFNLYWDNKWTCEASIKEGYYLTEIAIPFTTLRYKDNSKIWNLKAYRFDTQANEQSTLKQMPQSIIIMALGFTQPIEFEYPLKKAGGRFSLIPYTSGSYTTDQLKNSKSSKVNFGADAKVAVSSGLNLDLTVNPDFSTVEADRQQVNLTRFDITFPEQRQFFMENADMFTGFGSYNVNPFVPPSGGSVSSGNQVFSPFFSRKIGIALDSTTGTNVQTPIIYGAKLSGKLDHNWRLGLLSTQTASQPGKGIRASNYQVAAVSRRVFDRSNIAAIYVNKDVVNHGENDLGMAYNGLAGIEYNLQSKDNRWQGKMFYHKAFTPVSTGSKQAHGASLNYTTTKLIVKGSYEWLGAGFVSEAGFVPRNNFLHIAPTIGYNIFPKNSRIQRFSYGFSYDRYNKLDYGMTDLVSGPFVLLGFQNQVRILAQFSKNVTYLFDDFDALRANGKMPILKKGNTYNYHNVSFTYTSDLRKKFTSIMQPTVGQYFNGNIYSLRGELGCRIQPKATLTLNVNYNDIRLKEGSNKVMIIGPKTDITFTKNLYWTTYLQYNSQFDNLNINSRLQWRFAPVSDLFIVYSDNYDTGLWAAKNKAIIAKATYWLNL